MQKNFTDIKGVYGGAIESGIKPSGLDLAYIYVPDSYSSAGVFTRHAYRAPCVSYSEEVLLSGCIKAVVVNSGNANAATGAEGMANARRMAAQVATHLSIDAKEVAVASTGIIGVQLPIGKIDTGISKLLQETKKQEGDRVAEAIMTTDLVPKKVFLEKQFEAGKAVVAGIAKGSGMISPNMGTMLGFLVTNIKIDQVPLRAVLQTAADESFNMVSVDTDTSTNDLVIIISTGEIDLGAETEVATSEMITEASTELAKMIARDGEGAEKLIEVEVSGAISKSEARRIAKNVVDSPLVKTAIHGADPNWGRVIMAIGKTPNVTIKTDLVSVTFQGIEVLRGDYILLENREALAERLRSDTVNIAIDLQLGSETATAWGCDLTKGYIDINTDYN